MSLGSQLSGFTSFAPPERNPSAAQMSGSSPPTAPRACCENGRPILTDPHTGQTVCSCQYSSALLNYPRVPGLAESVYSASAYAAAVSQGYVSLGAEGSAFYSPLAGSPYDLKDSAEAWRSLAQPPFPYDPAMAVYPYGAGYGGLDLNARRKNATRENTNTLKAWLYEHRKNPYPTKGEKIMLAIITKMTLTQVSTWFANARRRLKKENKMTWSPRNRSEDGSDSVNGESDSEKTGEGNDVSGSHGDLDARLPRDGRSSPGADSDAGGSQERIINVDDEDSNHSFLHNDDDLMDHKPGDDDDDDDDDFAKHSREARSSLGQGRASPKPSVNDHDPVKVRSSSPRPCTEVRDSKEEERGSSPEPKSSSQSERGGSSSGGSGSSTSSSAKDADTAPPRPKIWSISEVLQSSGSSSSSSSGPSRPATISTAARPTSHNPPGGYFLLPPTAPSAWAAGVGARYGAMAGYPLSLSHTTLSYPYSLSTHTAAKAALQPPTAVSRSLAGLRGEAEKLTRTNGLFSPARDIDCIRSSVASGRLVESNI